MHINWLSKSNDIDIEVRNDGAAGDVKVTVQSWIDNGEWVRGESDASKWAREKFTTDNAPGPVFKSKLELVRSWQKTIRLDPGESKTINLVLDGFSYMGGHELSVRAAPAAN